VRTNSHITKYNTKIIISSVWNDNKSKALIITVLARAVVILLSVTASIIYFNKTNLKDDSVIENLNTAGRYIVICIGFVTAYFWLRCSWYDYQKILLLTCGLISQSFLMRTVSASLQNKTSPSLADQPTL
jgi:hypothetical protein